MEERYENVPIDELDEWLRALIREEIASFADMLADTHSTPTAQGTDLLRIARRLRSRNKG